jgi:hypothetical protein
VGAGAGVGRGDCVAISAGQCCFPYKARCDASQLSDKSSSQSYRYYEQQQGAWGALLLGLLLAAGAAYVGGGVAWATKASGQKRGLAGHPHYRHWEAVHGLVVDGVSFARGGGARRRGGGQQAAHAQRGDERPLRKQDKKEREPKAEKAKRAKSAKAASRLEEPLAPEPRPPPETAVVAAQATAAAGGGGRWVHVTG